jgi:hypothetical protein
MAVKEIGIRLNVSSTGEQKVIKNLNELESELQSLQAQLKTLDFGSEAFKKTATAIAGLRSKIDDVDKATEGIGAEKRFRALGDSVNILTGSFQVFSGALGLVITQEEDLEKVQRAEAAALQVLNIALGINSISTALVESATLRAGLATKAYTIATNLAARAQALFNAALAANPIGLVVAGLALLTAAIYGLVKAYNALFSVEAQQAKVLREVNKLENDLIKTRIEASKELEAQLIILTDSITTRNLEKKVLDDLTKAYPGLNAFVDKNNKLNKEGIEFLKLQIKLRQQEAALIAVQGKIVEREIEFETEAAEIRQEYGASAGLLIKELREDYDKELEPVIAVQNKYTKAVDDTLGKLRPYQETLQKQVKIDAKVKETGKQNNDILTSRGKLLQAITKLINQQNTELSALLETELEYTADILDKQTKILQDQEALLGRRNEVLKDTGEELEKQINDLLLAIVPTDEVLSQATDKYKALFDFVGDLVKAGQIDITENITPELLANVLGSFSGEFQKAFINLTDDSQQTLLDFFNELKTRTEAIQEIRKKLGLQRLNEKDLILSISDAEDEIYELYKNRLELGLTNQQVEEKGLEILKDKLDLVGQEKILRDALTKATTQQDKAAAQEALDAFLKFRDELEKGIVRSIKFYEGIEQITAQANKNLGDISKNVKEITKAFTPEELDKITKFFVDNVEDIDNVVFEVFNNLQKYQDRLGEEGLKKVLEGVGGAVKDLGADSKDELENTKKFLETYIAIGDVLGENTDDAKNLLKEVDKQIKTLNFEKFYDDLLKGLTRVDQELFRLLDRYYDGLQQRSSLALEQIANDEAAALSTIDKALEQTGANTKRLNEERSLLLKQFAKERFEIEKKSRINELKFSLAQIISDSALAVVNTLANVNPPLNLILAAATGALALGQVAAIRNQLTFTQSQQFIGRRGGLITGESHEGSNGGVPAMLEGGEFVVNRAAVAKYADIIGDLNSSTGGRRLAIDDSRIVQTIASQNQNTTPLKAFVLYNDIQNTEKLNSKITQLARL